MLLSNLIKAAQERFEIYGDINVVYRDDETYSEDADIFSLYYDDDNNKVILSGDLCLKERVESLNG